MNDMDSDVTESMMAASSLDQIQAMHSVLCYLCANNIEVNEVVMFLRMHPESLLLEGTSPADSARDIVEMHMSRCKCFATACNENRLEILHALDRGFEFYQGINLDVMDNAEVVVSHQGAQMLLTMHTNELCRLEHGIRELQFDEIAIRGAVLDATLERRTFSDELQKVDYEEKSQRRPLSRLACGRNGEVFNQRSVLEYHMDITSAKIASLEKKRVLVLREISFSHRMQVAILKNIFGGCHRHVCGAIK